MIFKEGRQEELDAILYALGEVCRIAAIIAAPVMPAAAAEVIRQLGFEESSDELLWARTLWGGWPAGGAALSPEPIFPRIEHKKPPAENAAAPQAKERGKEQAGYTAAVVVTPAATGAEPLPAEPASKEQAPKEQASEITIEDFARVQLRIATVTAAEKVEGARKLLRLSLDLGDEQRQIVSGIAEHYTSESLVGRQIVVIVNLKPATIRGVQSFGMLLAADADGKVVLLQPDQPAPPGSPVR